ncbi:MAG TPA: ABC transporter ATP-binding protein [Stellaceae bacterium]|nr:ABC transporter ATP-binding protein [Stellaceae bacterium]
MLSVGDIHASYGALAVLRGVSFEVEEGSVVALLGANGAGKTTTMKAVMGMLPVRGGRIEFLGERIDNKRPHDLVRRGLTLVPQSRELFPWMTVRENLDVAGLTFGGAKSARRACEEQFELFPQLRARADQRALTLSGGEQQMLAIARALMLRPKLILMDEPTTGLAPLMVRELGDTIRKLGAKGQTIVLVEQNLGLALSVARRIYVIQRGRTVFEGGAEGLQSEKDVLQYYLS